MNADPPVRLDNVCACGCRAALPGACVAAGDPFATPACANRWHNVEFPNVPDPGGRGRGRTRT